MALNSQLSTFNFIFGSAENEVTPGREIHLLVQLRDYGFFFDPG